MSANTTFFQDMPAMQSIREITTLAHYQDVPDDWFVAVTDVKGSTQAIADGQYKSVNTVAAATITAMLNSVPNVDIPFLFGGDGAAIVFPPEAYQAAADSLIAVRKLARQQFKLELRIGIVPVRDVLEAGQILKVAKLRVSDNFQQPVFTGGGLDYADSLLKTPDFATRYPLVETGDEQANFDGFECRWRKHPARYEEVLSLLIKATGDDRPANNRIYDTILTKLDDIYGNHSERHPIDVQQMMIAPNPNEFRYEVAIKNWNYTWRDVLSLFFWALGGYVLWKYKDKVWDDYAEVVRQATDHEKFDDMLRMTISGTLAQRRQLEAFLKEQFHAGDLVYGTHTAAHTLMTCIVFDRMGRQVHFLDADKGGYAEAARQLKQQLKARDAMTTQEVNQLISN